MVAQIQTKSPDPSQQLVTGLPETSHNENWLYAGTGDAWLYTNYRQLERDISTEPAITAYKLPQYAEDLNCYNCTTPKTNAEILAELADLDPEWVEF